MADPPAGYGGVGWSGGNFHDYDREYGVDLVQLAAFLRGAQPEAAEALALFEDGPTRRAFLTRLQSEIAKRGTIDVLHNGIKHGAMHLDIFYGTRSAHNPQARERFEQNRLTVTPQLRYSRNDVQPALDIGLFINGLPVFHVRVEEQPDQADGGRRGPAVPAASQPARDAVRVRALLLPARRGAPATVAVGPRSGHGGCHPTEVTGKLDARPADSLLSPPPMVMRSILGTALNGYYQPLAHALRLPLGIVSAFPRADHD